MIANKVRKFSEQDLPTLVFPWYDWDKLKEGGLDLHYLAIDIGASSGRHIVGWLEDGAVQTKEVYHFPNGVAEQDSQGP